MRIHHLLRCAVFAVLASFLNAALAHAICPSPRLEQFGYNSRPISGSRPLLVVLVDFADAELNPARNASAYRRLLFSSSAGATAPASINAMYNAASNGRFQFVSAGIVNVSWPTAGAPLPADFSAQVTRLAAAAMRSSGGRTMESFDRNGDRVINDTELAILRVSNSPIYRGLGQTSPYSATFGDGYQFIGQTANVDEEMDINGIAHELFHVLGFNDHIYGPGLALNNRGSFFAASFLATASPGPVALDPYHRMRAGWLAPRLVNMNSSNSMRLRVYGDSGDQDTLLFYDGERCASEFFLAEFHNPSLASAAVDRGAFGDGIYLWYVKPDSAFAPYQFNWPPPIRGPYAPTPAGTHAIADYLVGPRGPGQQTSLRFDTPEFEPSWGDGTRTGFGIETLYARPDSQAFVGWRRVPGTFVARIDAINGVINPTLPASVREPGRMPTGVEFAVTGAFPLRGTNISAFLVNLSSRVPLTIVSYAPDRIVLLTPVAPVQAGAYQVQLTRSGSREIATRGHLGVSIR